MASTEGSRTDGQVLTGSGRRAPILVGLGLVGIVLIAIVVLTTGSGSDEDATPTTSTPAAWQTQFLDCVKQRESGGDYTEIGPGGQAFGAYQITPESWNNTVAHYGWTQLAGVRPDQATPADQDMVAMGLLEWQGPGPWGGSCSA